MFYRIVATHVNLCFLGATVPYLRIYCNSKVVSNVYIFLTFATVYTYCVNAPFLSCTQISLKHEVWF